MGKTKNIRPSSTYLFSVEAGENGRTSVEAVGGGVLPCPRNLVGFVLEAGTAKSGYIAILIGDIFG